MASTIKDIVLVVSSVLSIVNLILLLAMFQSSLDLLQQQEVEHRELPTELQEDNKGVQAKAKHDDSDVTKSLSNEIRKGDDEAVRLKRNSIEGDKEATVIAGHKVNTRTAGAPGQNDVNGENGGGTVYVRWGHDQCPSTAELVYSGRAGGPGYNQAGGGSNPLCLPMEPSYLNPISGDQPWRATIHMYGAEHQTHNFDVPCAVCHVNNRTAVYMVPAKYTCPTGWTREYYGYLMAEATYNTRHRSQYICMDTALKPAVLEPSANNNNLAFYFVEGRCGSVPCPPYDNTKELSCAVCTK